jgi:DNA polymerase-3 subunit alpha
LKPILKAYKPSSILDLAIINAVFRPGVFDKIPKVVHHKMYGYESTFRSDIRVEQILKETFGVLIFQETFLDIVTQIAGFEATEAEYYLRILCRRKNQEKIDLFKKFFIEGCKIHSTLTSSEIELLATMMLKDGSQTFMKSHSLSYSMVGYWGAYYKTHFRELFDSSLTKSMLQL